MRPRTTLVFAAAAAVGAVALVGVAVADDATSRYPWDPACPWGRLSNGKGMLVRCLAESETLALRGAAAATGTPPASAAPAAAPSAPAAPATLPTAAPSTAPDAAAAPVPVTVTVGPVIPDSGKLPAAEKKLRAVASRFAACVTDHGGLEGAAGEVRIRFLVHDRGRAEGVDVARRRGVSAAAAKCIADVVDRRWVGAPSEPIIAATLVVKIAPKGSTR